MPSETTNNNGTTKPDPSLGDNRDEKMQKRLDLEIREMISALTNRLASLQQVHKVAGGSSSSHDHQEEDDEEGGVRIITLAGNNVGATMRGEMDEKVLTGNPDSGLPMGEHEALNTYVNSNFQAINNSIMMGGSYSASDPGVHMDISDYIMEHQTPPRPNPTADSKHGGKMGKEKHKRSSSPQSDQQSQHYSE